MPRHIRPRLALVIALAPALSAAHSGPLVPPAGPPADTFVTLEYKTLRQVEPRFPLDELSAGASGDFEITQPGSYYLTRNITAAGSPVTVAVITSGKVTIDLNGFTIDGANTTTVGVRAFAANSQLTIRNGAIANFNGIGVDVPLNLVLEDVTVVRCGSPTDPAIQTAIGARIERCHILQSPGRAIVADEAILVANTEIIETGDIAVEFFGPHSELRESRIRFSGGRAAVVGSSSSTFTLNEISDVTTGIEIFDGCRVHRNTISRAGQFGINILGGQNVVELNSTTQCNDIGIFVGSNGLNNRVLDNDASQCTVGFFVEGRFNVIQNNRAANNDFGFDILPGGENLITQNTAMFNAAVGFNIAPGNRDAFVFSPFSGFALPEPWANFEF